VTPGGRSTGTGREILAMGPPSSSGVTRWVQECTKRSPARMALAVGIQPNPTYLRRPCPSVTLKSPGCTFTNRNERQSSGPTIQSQPARAARRAPLRARRRPTLRS
jgi:hypothetical protein